MIHSLKMIYRLSRKRSYNRYYTKKDKYLMKNLLDILLELDY